MRITVTTLGCKVNQYESRALEEAFAARGHVLVPFGEAADAVVVNTCTVTHRSDADARALVRRARRANPDARIVVTGCYAQVAPEALERLGVDAVVGTGEKETIPDLVEAGERGTRVGDPTALRELRPQRVTRFGRRSRAFFKVQDGCEAFCAYCVVPYARGPSRSLPPEEVVRGLSRVRAAGHREAVLTGVHLGLWGRDLSPPQDFGRLLDLAEAAGIPRVRLSSLEPGELSSEVLARLRGSSVLCPHLHVPLQSGSDRILAAMGRPYTAAAFRDRIERALDCLPGVCLGFDVIAGFPGEDEEAFEETRSLLAALPWAYLHVFPFSPRPGTRAHDLPGRVDAAVVRQRARVLRELSARKRQAFHAAALGQTLPALAEGDPEDGWLTLRTRNYIPVRVRWDGAVTPKEVPVTLERLAGAGVIGRVPGSSGGGSRPGSRGD